MWFKRNRSEDVLDGPDDFDAAGLRLKARSRVAALGVLLLSFLPYEVVDGHPQFIWDLWGELPPAGLIASLAPALAGLLVLGAGALFADRLKLAVATLAAFVGMSLLIKLGADAAAWDFFPLPDSLSQRSVLGLLALALVAAGVDLSFHAEHRRAARGLLGGAVAVAAFFFLWPGRGESPGVTIWRVLAALPEVDDVRLQVGFGVLAVMLLWPAIMAIAGLWYVWRPAKDARPTLAVVAVYGLPLMLAMLVFRGIPEMGPGAGLLLGAGSILVLAASTALLASALEVAAPSLLVAAGRRALARPAVVAVAALGLLSGGQALLARPPEKGVAWTLKAPTPEADALFGARVHEWNRARVDWEGDARDQSGAEALVELRGKSKALVEAARAVDGRLGEAFQALTDESVSFKLAGRRWYRLVAQINEASQAAGLPYYLDPSVYLYRGGEGEGLKRRFKVRSYRVMAVHGFERAGQRFATLDVERLDDGHDSERLLGFSRDLQPFAVVDLKAIARDADALREAASLPPPACLHGGANRLYSEGMAERCGVTLRKLVDELSPEGVEDALIALTRRHELQHQLDGPHLTVSAAVLKHLPNHEDSLREQVNRELSAYTAELTADDAPALLGLLHLFPFVVAQRGGAAHHAGVILLERLGQVETPLTEAATGYVDVIEALEILESLAALDEATLQGRVREVYEELFGVALPVLTRI